MAGEPDSPGHPQRCAIEGGALCSATYIKLAGGATQRDANQVYEYVRYYVSEGSE